MLVYYGDRYDSIPDDYSLVVVEDRDTAESFIKRALNPPFSAM